MNILYYDWDEFNGEDCRDAFSRLGHHVEKVKATSDSYCLTDQMRQAFLPYLDKKENGKCFFDFVYSFDYYPGVSMLCQEYGITYVSWVFDCPHYSLDSHSINNPVNRVFVFDRLLYEDMKKKGVETIYYSPLGVNSKRLMDLCNELDSETDGKIIYEHDVCFLGNLYDNEFNFYDQINYLPEKLKGYIDGVIAAQERFFGMDLFSNPSVISDDMIKELRKYINFENSGNFEIDYDKVLLDIFRKKVTVNERHNILKEMGRNFDTVLYTMPGAAPIENVANLGMADYVNKMPRIFRRSKINLNITLRSIISGIPLRVIDILAAGGFLITGYQPEIAEYFEDGKDLVMAMTPEDMVEKAAYYLENEEERQEIALNGQKKVLENFDYQKLLTEIIQKI